VSRYQVLTTQLFLLLLNFKGYLLVGLQFDLDFFACFYLLVGLQFDLDFFACFMGQCIDTKILFLKFNIISKELHWQLLMDYFGLNCSSKFHMLIHG
jgi:hypothetical protein